MSARDIVGGLAGAAFGAVRHPVETAEEAISKARTAAAAGTAVGTAVAGTVVRRVRGGAGEATEKASDAAKETADKAVGAVKDPAGAAKETVAKATDVAKTATAKAGDAAKATTAKAGDAATSTAGKAAETAKTAKKAPAKKSTAKKAPAKKAPAKKAPAREPQIVLAEPAPPELPPIDVVGQALAAEAEGDTIGAGRTTEPRGASRDEEHGDAALQRAEAEEIAEEMVEMTEAGNLDIDTPVHTTGADVAFNPDTAEADLQQPGTEPLLDPSLTKAVKAEQETLSEAAEPRKPLPRKKKNS